MVAAQFEEELERMSMLEGLHRKDHVLELNRLMLRAESTEHRMLLLKVLQVTLLHRYSTSYLMGFNWFLFT